MTNIRTPENLGALLDLAVVDYPTADALNFFEDSLTVSYSELRQHVNQAANGLRSLGVSKGVHVGIMASNSLMFYCVWFGLAKLGAVAIAINTRYTSRELNFVLKDAEARYLVIDSEFLDIFDATDINKSGDLDGKIISTKESHALISWQDLVGKQSIEFENPYAVTADDLVNIQYTSGTTGFPKGCMLSHRFWMHSSKVTVKSLGFDFRRVLYNQNFFYMDGPFVAVSCMHIGACLYIANRPSARKFSHWIRDYQIEYCYFYEAVYKIPASPRDADNSLKLLHTFGFNKTNHVDLENRFATRAREAYGSTECGAVLAMPIDCEDMVGSGSCGLAIVDREVMIADDEGLPVEHGKVGELWVSGPGMMLGYYKNALATADTMVNGWVKTGDLFRQDNRGFFYIVGRKKDMIRRNGENIACREVESVLRELTQIKEAAVVPVVDDRVGEEVKAYVLLQAGETVKTLSPQQIIDHCASRLAVFKQPRYIQYINSFPMTESARVEKSKLIANSKDLTRNSFDARDNVWR